MKREEEEEEERGMARKDWRWEKGGNTKDGRGERWGRKGVGMVSQWEQSEISISLTPACTLLFDCLSAATPSLQLEFCLFKRNQGFPRLHIEVGCFTCDEANAEWAHWCVCVTVTVQKWQILSSRIWSFLYCNISSSWHCCVRVKILHGWIFNLAPKSQSRKEKMESRNMFS